MNLQFKNLADYVGKRFDAIEANATVYQELTVKLNQLGGFDRKDIASVDPALMQHRYLLLQILDATRSAEMEVDGCQCRAELDANKEYRLDLQCTHPGMERMLALFRSYLPLLKQPTFWLVGGETGLWQNDPETRYDHPFHTKALIKNEGLEASFHEVQSDAEIPFWPYARGEHFFFTCPGGLPVLEQFVRRFPYQYNEAVVDGEGCTVKFEPQRKRNEGWDVTGYGVVVTAKTPWKTPSKDHLVTLARAMDAGIETTKGK